MPARDYQGERRELDLRILEDHRKDVTLDMVHTDQWDREAKCQRLCIADTHKQRSDEAGSLRDGDGIYRVEPNIGFSKCLRDYALDLCEVLARGELGNDTSVRFVKIDLRSDDGRHDPAPLVYDSGGSFIARCFDSKDQHILRIEDKGRTEKQPSLGKHKKDAALADGAKRQLTRSYRQNYYILPLARSPL